MPESLESILSANTGATPEPEPTEPPKAVEPAEEAAAEPETAPETPQEAAESKPEPDKTGAEAETSAEKPAQTQVDLGALIDERLKRQEEQSKRRELEARLAELERERSTLSEAPDLYDDPQGYVKYLQQNTQQALKTMQQQFEERLRAQSEIAARARHDDFDEKLSAFEAAAKEQPALVAEMVRSVDPGEYVYTVGANALALRDIGDGNLDDWRQRERERIRAELKAELSAEPTDSEPAPSSLSDVKNASGKKGKPKPAYTPLESILRN